MTQGRRQTRGSATPADAAASKRPAGRETRATPARRQAELIPAEQAGHEPPPLPVMGHTLAMLVNRVPASLSAFFARLHDGPVVTRLEAGSISPRVLEAAFRRYGRLARYRDPFTSAALVQRAHRVATIDDLGERDAFERSAYGRFLRDFRVHSQANLYLRRSGTIVGRVVLLRAGGIPPFDKRELAFLHVSQPLIELAYGSAYSLRDATDSGFIAAVADLTPREAEVVRLAVSGATNDEIGRALHVARSTVKTHLSHAFAKLGVRSRTELAARLGAA